MHIRLLSGNRELTPAGLTGDPCVGPTSLKPAPPPAQGHLKSVKGAEGAPQGHRR